MDRIEEIDRELQGLRQELETVKGTGTEVYSRIVGYYRSLRNWNRGKREEFVHRTPFGVVGLPILESHSRRKTETVAAVPVGGSARYELFVRDACPNCPPMKKAAQHLDMPGRLIDVDTEAGNDRAAELSIYATPTIVFFDEHGTETARTASAADLTRQFAVV